MLPEESGGSRQSERQLLEPREAGEAFCEEFSLAGSPPPLVVWSVEHGDNHI